MADRYDHQKIESKWQKFWENEKLFAAADKSRKKKFYCLIEFPYPSGEGLHVGHPRSYTALDVLARKRRMEGYNVLYPIGYDAFGLPSENYAIKTGIHPAETTKKNIASFTKQRKALGFSFDWGRTVTTTAPAYYKWTQWIFLKLFEHDMAYKASMPINWCLSCNIGLANEEVVNGRCERCGGEVEKRLKEQWMLRITKYADRLIDDLDLVDYPERVKAQQINWIGKSHGAEINFQIANQKEALTVFTTRPDTLFGATFMVVAPEHPAISNLESRISNLDEVRAYIRRALEKSDIERTDASKEKTGVELKGVAAINPATAEKIPILVADYVLLSYGTGAIMAVPAHDQRDWEFAKKMKLPIVEVVSGGDISKGAYEPLVGELVNSGKFSGQSVTKSQIEIIRWLENRKIGKATVAYKLRDWVFSRQRYWGEPIPIINCETCGYVPVPEKDLPVVLPEVENFKPTQSGQSPLAAIESWVNVTCPKCKGKAKREIDVMPNWAGSNWYYMRYIDPRNTKALAAADKLERWMPVDWYNGGMEHTTLHLLYSRFIYKFLYDIGVVPARCGPEPYKKRTSHGLILGEGGEKMSKSKGNVVNPDEVVGKFGADTLRLYEMFMGPFDQAIPWDSAGVAGTRRFIEKVWTMFTGRASVVKSADESLLMLMHQTIKKVSRDIETQDYNTAISALMILANAIATGGSMDRFIRENFLKLLSPFAPHVAEELWLKTKHKRSIQLEAWPSYDEAMLVGQQFELIIQINGKVRASVVVDADITEQLAETTARHLDKVALHLEGKTVQNIIFVPGRLINFVVT